MSIPFTQYLRPNGYSRPIEIDMPPDIEGMAQELIVLGCHFDAEVLTTGKISFTCERDDDLFSIQLCDNGPQVIEAVRDLVIGARRKVKEQS